MNTKASTQQASSDAAPSGSQQPALNPIIHRLYYQWQNVQERMRTEIGDNAYNNWLKPLVPTGQVDGEVLLAVPTRFMRDWVVRHYVDRIRQLWSAEDGSVRRVEIIISPNAAANLAKAVSEAPPPPPEVLKPSQPANQARPTRLSATAIRSEDAGNFSAGSASDEALVAQLDPRFTFENFVVGKPNELAHAAARRVAESDNVPFNPLFLYGGVGLGKTHLMHAIGWAIRNKTPERKVLYLSAEKFMYQFIRALRFKDTMAFKEQFRSVDVLMIDDVQFISGKDSTQEEFFHTFNALVDQNRQIIISADKSPSSLEGLEERLRSRLGWGLVADIHPTSYELRLGILQAKADSLKVDVPPKVMEFLAHKITSNVRELEGALNRLVAHADLVGRSITLDTVQDVLQDLLRASDRRITIDEIQRRVAEHYNIRVADMHSARRARAVARPRQVAMFLAKQLTSRSLPEIGRKFGGRDHTTVMHAVRKIEEICSTDSAFAEDVELLKRMLAG
jgi:chromosomal replication initiator protein